jgi:hypothetical protein
VRKRTLSIEIGSGWFALAVLALILIGVYIWRTAPAHGQAQITPAPPILGYGCYNSSPPALTSGGIGCLQVDINGRTLLH